MLWVCQGSSAAGGNADIMKRSFFVAILATFVTAAPSSAQRPLDPGSGLVHQSHFDVDDARDGHDGLTDDMVKLLDKFSPVIMLSCVVRQWADDTSSSCADPKRNSSQARSST